MRRRRASTTRSASATSSEIAPCEAGEGGGADERQVGDRPEHEPRAAGVGAAERAELERELGEAARVSRERVEPVLVESLERERPRRDPRDALERVRAD